MYTLADPSQYLPASPAYEKILNISQIQPYHKLTRQIKKITNLNKQNMLSFPQGWRR
uniref:Uncharacterized protein n=1 Tax=Rhizophora mucronata TaxID=61149 RepID=A0A2P2QF58_RHIMU